MHRPVFSLIAPASAALVLATATVSGTAQTAAAPSVVHPATLDFQQVVERVVTKGYNDVREVERKSDRLYEIKARNGQGRRVELYVDARDGEILREKIKR